MMKMDMIDLLIFIFFFCMFFIVTIYNIKYYLNIVDMLIVNIYSW